MTFLVAPLAQAALAVASAAPTPDLDALLLARLREQYPAVAHWQIHRFSDRMQIRSGAASVLRLGSRSAVRVGDHVYWYSVAGFQTVVSAARMVPSGGSLNAQLGLSGEADVLAVGCEPLTDPSRLDGSRARRVLHAGQVICRNEIEVRPPVARGDEVTVRYIGAAMSLTTTGIAESDGTLGADVEVKKPNAPAIYRAVVSGEREVTIHE
jgi:flagella basal body P-ring formation protein FlgA